MQKSALTKKHYEAFGRYMNEHARLEVILHFVIADLLGVPTSMAGDRIRLSAAAPLPDDLVEAIRADRNQVIEALRPTRPKVSDGDTPAAWRGW